MYKIKECMTVSICCVRARTCVYRIIIVCARMRWHAYVVRVRVCADDILCQEK